MKLVAGGNAPGKLVNLPNPVRVAHVPSKGFHLHDMARRKCDPFRVGTEISPARGALPRLLTSCLSGMLLLANAVTGSATLASCSQRIRNTTRPLTKLQSQRNRLIHLRHGFAAGRAARARRRRKMGLK